MTSNRFNFYSCIFLLCISISSEKLTSANKDGVVPFRFRSDLGSGNLKYDRLWVWYVAKAVALINMGVFTCTAVAPGAGLERRLEARCLAVTFLLSSGALYVCVAFTTYLLSAG